MDGAGATGRQRDNSIQLTDQHEEDSSSTNATTGYEAPPPADLSLHISRLVAAATLGASVVVGMEIRMSPDADKNQLLLASQISMGISALLCGSILLGDMITTYCGKNDPDVHLLHQAIRTTVAVLLGGSAAHLALLPTFLAIDGTAPLALAITIIIAAGMFLAADTKNNYYPDLTPGFCKRAEIIKTGRNLTVTESISTEDPWHNSDDT